MNRPVAAGRDLRREIGKWGFGAIALNGTIGAGIFALPAIAVQQAGWFSPWVFALCGALIMAIVLVFARVASLVGDTGGPVAYAATAFGPFAGFQAGWLLTLSRAAAFAANAHLIVTYLAWFLPPLASGPLHTATVLALCLGMATSFALLLVIGCPPNAISYSYRYFKASDLTKAGLVATPLLLIVLILVAAVWWKILGLV